LEQGALLALGARRRFAPDLPVAMHGFHRSLRACRGSERRDGHRGEPCAENDAPAAAERLDCGTLAWNHHHSPISGGRPPGGSNRGGRIRLFPAYLGGSPVKQLGTAWNRRAFHNLWAATRALRPKPS